MRVQCEMCDSGSPAVCVTKIKTVQDSNSFCSLITQRWRIIIANQHKTKEIREIPPPFSLQDHNSHPIITQQEEQWQDCSATHHKEFNPFTEANHRNPDRVKQIQDRLLIIVMPQDSLTNCFKANHWGVCVCVCMLIMSNQTICKSSEVSELDGELHAGCFHTHTHTWGSDLCRLKHLNNYFCSDVHAAVCKWFTSVCKTFKCVASITAEPVTCQTEHGFVLSVMLHAKLIFTHFAIISAFCEQHHLNHFDEVKLHPQ